MAKVYIVSALDYKEAYHAEPFRDERIVKVLDSYDKVVNYICETIKEDHKKFDTADTYMTYLTKYEPNPDYLGEGYFINSWEYRDDWHCIARRYMYKSYDLE